MIIYKNTKCQWLRRLPCSLPPFLGCSSSLLVLAPGRIFFAQRRSARLWLKPHKCRFTPLARLRAMRPRARLAPLGSRPRPSGQRAAALLAADAAFLFYNYTFIHFLCVFYAHFRKKNSARRITRLSFIILFFHIYSKTPLRPRLHIYAYRAGQVRRCKGWACFFFIHFCLCNCMFMRKFAMVNL